MIGPEFAEILTMDERGTEVCHQFWELRSSVILPPMPRERLICRDRTPDEYASVVGIRDGDCSKEIQYREGEIRKLEPFDFALTFEKIFVECWQKLHSDSGDSAWGRTFSLSGIQCDWIPIEPAHEKSQRCLSKSWDLDATPCVLKSRADHMHGNANSLHKKIDLAGLTWRDLDNLAEFPENPATADLILTRSQAAYAGRPELQRVIEVWRVTIE